jgi:hypothetical protein
METTCFSETAVDFQRTTQRYIPEDTNLHNHRCENLKSDTDLQYIRENKLIKTTLEAR